MPDGRTSKQEHRQGTLERGLLLLEYLARTGRSTPAAAGRALGFSRSATYRILGLLAERGYVQWDPGGEQARLGLRTVELGMAALGDRDVVRFAQPYLRDVARETGESALLAVCSGEEMVYVACDIGAERSVQLLPKLGDRRQLYSTALGKAYLAALPLDEADQIVDRLTYRRHTPNTITDAATLRRELDATRVRGYAVDNIENEDGVACYAAAIFDYRGLPAAATSIAGPAERMRAREETLGPLVVVTAQAISHRMGFVGPSRR